jgi:DNA-binding NtrC family response regulator
MTATASILMVDDDAAFRGAMKTELERLRFDVDTAASGEEALRRMAAHEPEIVLLDLQMPDASGLDVLAAIRDRHPSTDVIMLTGHGSIDTAISAIRAGAFDYIAKPCPLDEIEVRIGRALERQALRRRATLLERGLTPPDPGDSFVGASPEFRSLLGLIARVAPTDSAVLITGETGTGKEMAAKLIHARSARRNGPFVVVECAALQESLLQSELFGHERGAFTGADRTKPGLFEVAAGGTIFLDEIGEVSLATQVKLLRVLDSGTFRHVGGTAELRVNARVIAATNRDLEAMVRNGLFREDLYYRLMTIALRLPPLRSRIGDVELLAEHFVARLNERFGSDRRLGAAARARLARHTWPGNVRELLHVIEAAMIVCETDEIGPHHLPAALQNGQPSPASAPSAGDAPAGTRRASASPPDEFATLSSLERTHILEALDKAGGHRGRAARMLGISERNLYRKLNEYGVERGPDTTS